MLDLETAATSVDLLFPVRGEPVPYDHAFMLFEAIAAKVGGTRHLERWAIHPLRGRRVSEGNLAFDSRSALVLRVPVAEVEAARRLTDATLSLDGVPLTLGPPTVIRLAPSPMLRSEFVSLAGEVEDDKRAERALRGELERLPIQQPLPTIAITIGRRRLMAVRDKTIVGFAAELHGLEAPASVAIQESGVGARKQLGAGLFVVPQARRR